MKVLALCGVMLIYFSNISLCFSSTIKFQDGDKWKNSKNWKEVYELKSKQQYQKALNKLSLRLKEFISDNDKKNWTRALILKQELMMSLGQFEKALIDYKESNWPDSEVAQTILSLYYIQSLNKYYQRYSWEISKRQTKENLKRSINNIKDWTKKEISIEIQNYFISLWEKRQSLKLISKNVLKDYLKLGNYPENVRKTLRNTLTHLYVQYLSNTLYWSPKESNEVKQLDLNILLKDQKNWAEIKYLKNSSVHPLKKIMGLLSDLEKWHWNNDHIASLLDTKIARFNQLTQHFHDEDEIKRLLKYLKSETKDYQIDSWWAEVAYIRAMQTMKLQDEDSYIKALAIAKKGFSLFPDELGGKHCKNLINQILQPEVNINILAKDQMNKDSIEISHRNWDKAYFKAYLFDPIKYLLSNEKHRYLPGRKKLKEILKDQPVLEWEQDLAKVDNYKMHKTYAKIPLKSKGFYVIQSSIKKDSKVGDKDSSYHYFNLSDLAVVSQQSKRGVKFRLHLGDNGQVVPSAKLSLYKNNWKTGHKLEKEYKFSKKGELSIDKKSLPASHSFFYSIKTKNDLLYKLDSFYAYSRNNNKDILRHLIITDRGIYRPGQTVYYKIITFKDRSQKALLPQVISGKKLKISLKDNNWKLLQENEHKSNKFGTSSGSFTLPKGKNLGQWSLNISSGSGTTYIKVEEYKRPTFFAELLENKEQLSFNNKARIKGKATYYYGRPVSDAKVKWTITRRPEYPYWYFWYRSIPSQNQSQIIAAGETKLNKDGEFESEFLPKASKSEIKDGVKYQYALSATIIDMGGESHTLEKIFTIGAVALKAKVLLEDSYLKSNSTPKFKINVTDLNNEAQLTKGEWKLVLLKSPDKTITPEKWKYIMPVDKVFKYQTDGDKQIFRTRTNIDNDKILSSWKILKEIKKGKLSSKNDSPKIGKLKAGAYRLIFETKDKFGQKVMADKSFIVFDSNKNISLPVLLEVSKKTAYLTDSLSFYTETGYKGNDLFFEIIKGDDILFKKQFKNSSKGHYLKFKLNKKHLGGITARVYTFKDHILIKKVINIEVPHYSNQLSFDVSRIKESVYPGSSQAWKISLKAKNSENKPYRLKKQIEALAFMYDKSLDVFTAHTPSKLSDFYPKNYVHYPLNYSLQLARKKNYIKIKKEVSLGYSLISDNLPYFSNHALGGLGTRGGLKSLQMAKKPKGAMVSEIMDDSEMISKKENRLDKTASEKPQLKKSSSNEGIKIRSNFNETAFFKPHLKTNKKGDLELIFKIPDSLTTWKLWLQAIDKNSSFGQQSLEVIAKKDLMVKTYLPRFFRQKDKASLKVVVSNSSKKKLKGKLFFDVLSLQNKSLNKEFQIPIKFLNGLNVSLNANEAKDYIIPIKVLSETGTFRFKTMIKTKALTDGEEHSLNVLPSRVYLSQSKFTNLTNKEEKIINFQDMTKSDETRANESLVIKIDSQLFYSTLEALPYLMNYPYKSAIQLTTDFVSTNILSQTYDKNPAVAKMAKKLSKRKTRLDPIRSDDPNLKMKLEETPWLINNSSPDIKKLINTLNPQVVKNHLDEVLKDLKKHQTSSGGFSWYLGGRPSSYVTLYVLHSFARVQEFKGEIPKKILAKAWKFIQKEYTERVSSCLKKKACFEFITYVNYILSSFKDSNHFTSAFSLDERKKMLEYSFKHWKEHSPLLKTMLALTLFRSKREKDAKLILASILDSAKTDKIKGVFWTPESRSWLWYNDTIESQAYILRAILEIDPKNKLKDGIVKWIFLNKKLNQWKSTRATAEVIYVLTHYLILEGSIEQDNFIEVTVGTKKQKIEIKSDEYTGKNHFILLEGKEFDSKKMNQIKINQAKKGISFAFANWHFSTEKLPKTKSSEFFSIERKYFLRILKNKEYVLKEIKIGENLNIGDEIEIHLILNSKHIAKYIHLKDPRPSGFEPAKQVSRYKWDLGLSRYEQVRDTGMNFFIEYLPDGEYVLKHRIKATMAGTFKVAPASLQSIYAPEFNAYSSGFEIKVLDDGK